MNEQREKLSSLMDEYQSVEDGSVLDDVLDDVNQQYTLRRYQMMGEVMRNELPDRVQLDFASQVMAQIEKEPALNGAPVTEEKSSTSSSWHWSSLFKPVAGLAVAASVALVAVNSLQLQTPQTDDAQQVASTESAAKVEQLANIPVINNDGSNAVKVSGNGQSQPVQAGTSWKIKRNEPALQNKLNTYLINHNEHSNSMHGIIPQVRVVGFDAER